MNVVQSDPQTFVVPAGQMLTIAADSVSAGTVYQLGNQAGNPSLAKTAIAASQSTIFGPFNTQTRWRVEASAGLLSATMALASAAQIVAQGDETGSSPLSGTPGAIVKFGLDGLSGEDSRITDDGTAITSPTINFQLGDYATTAVDYFQFYHTGNGQVLDSSGQKDDGSHFYQLTANGEFGTVFLTGDNAGLLLDGVNKTITATADAVSGVINLNASAVNVNNAPLAPAAIVTNSTPTTGQTVSAGTAKKDETLYITPAGTLLALTVSLPAAADSRVGQIIRGFISQIITGLTVSAAGGGSVVGATPVTSAVNSTFAYQCAVAGTWIRIQ